jgi:integrase
MIAIKSIPHLYKRGDKFYLRIVLPSECKSSELWLSLKTNCYKLARHLILKLSNHIEALKLLNTSDVTLMERLYKKIRDRMKKDLDYEIIDSLCNDYEANGYERSIRLKYEFTEFPSSEGCSELIKEFLSLVPRNDCDALIEFNLKACHLEELQSHEDMVAYLTFVSWKRYQLYKLGYIQIDDKVYDFLACMLLEQKGIGYDVSTPVFNAFKDKLKDSVDLTEDHNHKIFSGTAQERREASRLLNKKAPVQEYSGHGAIAVNEEKPPLFSEVYSEFMEYKINKANLSAKMQSNYEQYFAMWSSFNEDKPISEYIRKDIRLYIDACFELPTSNKKPYNTMDWDEKFNCDVPTDDRLAPKTVHSQYKWLQGLFRFASDELRGYIDETPCKINVTFKARPRGEFSQSEVKSLLGYEQGTDTHWLIKLGAYTGARQGELINLMKSDLILDKESGVYYLSINDAEEGKSLKTANARRKIPLHSDIRDSFIQYVEALRRDRIFEIKQKRFQHLFPTIMNQLQINRENEDGEWRSYHSLRHFFITSALSKGCSPVQLQMVVGHEKQKLGVTESYMHKRMELNDAQTVVDSVVI